MTNPTGPAPARHDGHAATSVTDVALSWEPVGPRLQPRWRFAWIWAAIWLAYLSQPFLVAWHQPDPLARWISLVTLAARPDVYPVEVHGLDDAGLDELVAAGGHALRRIWSAF